MSLSLLLASPIENAVLTAAWKKTKTVCCRSHSTFFCSCRGCERGISPLLFSLLLFLPHRHLSLRCSGFFFYAGSSTEALHIRIHCLLFSSFQVAITQQPHSQRSVPLGIDFSPFMAWCMLLFSGIFFFSFLRLSHHCRDCFSILSSFCFSFASLASLLQADTESVALDYTRIVVRSPGGLDPLLRFKQRKGRTKITGRQLTRMTLS